MVEVDINAGPSGVPTKVLVPPLPAPTQQSVICSVFPSISFTNPNTWNAPGNGTWSAQYSNSLFSVSTTTGRITWLGESGTNFEVQAWVSANCADPALDLSLELAIDINNSLVGNTTTVNFSGVQYLQGAMINPEGFCNIAVRRNLNLNQNQFVSMVFRERQAGASTFSFIAMQLLIRQSDS